jgi:hypothetical protein
MASGTGRLDRQRQPGRYHARQNSRWYRRGYKVLPHSVWGDHIQSGSTPGGTQKPTGVVAGSPGHFTPVGCDVPDNLAELSALGPLGQTTPWAVGQYVPLDPVGSAYWNGTQWRLGVGTGGATQDAHVSDPGDFTIAEIQEWLDHHPVLALAQALRDNEAARSTPRVTLLDWLDGFIESLDGPD